MVFSLYPILGEGDRIPVRTSGCLGLAKTLYGRRERSGMMSLQESGEGSGLGAYHQPVMVEEVVEALEVREGTLVFDGTLGGGGHSGRLLEAGAKVVACDRDPAALAYARERLAAYGERFQAYHGNYDQMDSLLAEAGEENGVDGMVLDLGVSSKHVDDASRGFSFAKDGPLDMRMDSTAELTAAHLVNDGDEGELLRIFWEYGEEGAARVLVKAIVKARGDGRIESTGQLAGLIERVIPRRGKRHPATKVFQALRIAVNDELGHLQRALGKSVACLKPGGRLAIISFHSLEDRMVKQFLRRHSQAMLDRPEWPEPKSNPEYFFSLPMKKPRVPGRYELEGNPRARSAKLRVAVRLGCIAQDFSK